MPPHERSVGCPPRIVGGVDPSQVPELTVVDSLPWWMDDAGLATTREKPLWLDDEPPQGFLHALVADASASRGVRSCRDPR